MEKKWRAGSLRIQAGTERERLPIGRLHPVPGRANRPYQLAIGEIVKNHAGLVSVHLFPAVPAPIAVLCGREILPKVHPELRIYDNNKRHGGFTYQLTINQI